MKVYATNRKARHDYELLDRYEGGLVLTGAEVKSIRDGKINIQNGFVRIEGNEAWLWNAHIKPWKFAGSQLAQYDATKSRKVLLRKSEIRHLTGKVKQKGLTLVPLRVYDKGGRIKLEFALAKGRKAHDKRRRTKEKEEKRALHKEKRELMAGQQGGNGDIEHFFPAF